MRCFQCAHTVDHPLELDTMVGIAGASAFRDCMIDGTSGPPVDCRSNTNDNVHFLQVQTLEVVKLPRLSNLMQLAKSSKLFQR